MGVLIAAAMLSSASHSQAQTCMPNSTTAPPPGTSVICSGNILNGDGNNGFGDGTQIGLFITVPSGSLVTGTDNGFALSTSNLINNSGAITGINNNGIDAAGPLTVINSGTIDGQGNAGISLSAGALMLNNSGTVNGALFGLSADDIFLANGPGGRITSGDIAIFANNSVIGINEGQIIGTTFAISVQGTAGQTSVNLTNRGMIFGPDGAIFVPNGDVIVNNYGVISSTTLFGGASAIAAVNGNVTVYNEGTIFGGQRGVSAFNGNLSVVNSGTIAGDQFGLFSQGGVTSLVNTGSVSSSMTFGSVAIAGDDVTVVNRGKIIGDTGIAAFNGVANVVNYGTITAGNNPGQSVGVVGPQVFLANYGTISGDTGVIGGPFGGNVVVNSGTIRGAFSSVDFSLSPGGDTLTLLPGSRLIGSVEMGSFNAPSTVNIHTGKDLAWLITFGACGCGGIVENQSIVNFYGKGPYIVVGNQIATLDATAFGLADKNLMDFTGWVSSLLVGRLGETSGGAGPGATAFAAASNPIVDTANAAFASAMPVNAYAANEKGPGALPNSSYTDRNSGLTFWTRGFAGLRNQAGDDVFLASHSYAYGGAVGVDTMVRPDLRLGLFFGAGYAKFEVDKSSQTVETDYFFGGGYGRFDWNAHFFDFAVTLGHSSNDNTRLVANNMAVDGIDTAKSKYDGWFVSPEIAYGIRMPLASDLVLTPVARVRYLTGHFDGYNESGSAQNLVVNARDVQDLEERLELNLTSYKPLFGGVLKITGTVGGVALQRVGDKTVSTVLLGQNLAFATPGDNASWGGYVGLGFDYRASQSVSLFAGIEGMAMDDKSRTGTVKGGARIAF